MNKFICTILEITVLVILSGCRTSLPSYSSEVSVRSIPPNHNKQEQYFVEVNVFRVEKGKKPLLVSSPHLTVIEDKEGRVSVQTGGSVFATTALVTRETGELELVTTITKTKNKIITWSETNRTAIVK